MSFLDVERLLNAILGMRESAVGRLPNEQERGCYLAKDR
jgi:hypothetical protein